MTRNRHAVAALTSLALLATGTWSAAAAPAAKKPSPKKPAAGTASRPLDLRRAEKDLGALDSYRVRYRYVVRNKDEDVTDTTDYTRSIVRATGDQAFHYQQRNKTLNVDIAAYRVAGQERMVSQMNGQVSTFAGFNDPFTRADVADLTGFRTGRLVARAETVNDIVADRYRFDQPPMNGYYVKGSMKADIWLAQKGGYVVRYTAQAAMSDGTRTTWQFDLLDVNKVEPIKMPEAASREAESP